MPTYTIFIDFGRAFGRVNRLWAIKSKKGIPRHLITVVQGVYVENKILIETVRQNTNPSLGLIYYVVRQECTLSPALFNLYIDDIVHNSQMKPPEHFMIRDSAVDTVFLLVTRLSCRTRKATCIWLYTPYIEYAKFSE